MPSPYPAIRNTLAALGAGLALLLAQPSLAAFQPALNLKNFNPDVQVTDTLGGLALNYVYTGGDQTSVLTISGTGRVGTYTDIDGNNTGGGFLDYSLTANFLNNGSLLDTSELNTLLITAGTGGFSTGLGTIAAGDLILSGNIYNFGFSTGDTPSAGSGSGTFEFLLNNLQSDAPDVLDWDLGTFGQVIASTVDGLNVTDGSWLSGTTNFSAASGVIADNSVPVPATFALVGFGLIGFAFARRKRQQA